MRLADHFKHIALSLVGLGLLALAAAIGLSQRSSGSATPPPPPAAASSPVSVVGGVTMVRIDSATQRRSGIATDRLTATTQRNETVAFGKVLDLQPLVDLRSRRDAAQADATAAKAAAAATRAELDRSRALYEDQRNVSLKDYQAAQAADVANQARAEAAGHAVDNIEASAQLQFGSTLASWAFEPSSVVLRRLVKGKEALVSVTLPPAADRRAPPPKIQVQTSGGDRISGTLVSPAVQADPGVAGTSFVYRVTSPLQVGAPVTAYLPATTGEPQGVFVPSSAVVWYAGQPWIYVQAGANRFARLALNHPSATEEGYIVAAGLQPNQRAVTRGAGILLSEEQRPPPGGASCKDPECD